MVTNFVLGITFSYKILVKLRRHFGTAPMGPPPPFHSNFIRKCYPRKNPYGALTLAAAAVRLRRSLANLTRTLIRSNILSQYSIMKSTLASKFLGEKVFFGRKNHFWAKNIFCPKFLKTFFGQIFFRPKNICPKKVLAEKIFARKKFWPKKYLSEKSLGRILNWPSFTPHDYSSLVESTSYKNSKNQNF